MSESFDTGTQGAKRQSWRRANPRDLLKRVMEKHKGADKDALLKWFRDALHEHEDSDELIDSIVEYWFANNYHSLVGDGARPQRRTQEGKTAAVSAIKEKIKERIREEAMFLLTTMLPNGKALKDTTFGECANMGGVLSLIATKGKPSQIVGKHLSDEQLRELQRKDAP